MTGFLLGLASAVTASVFGWIIQTLLKENRELRKTHRANDDKRTEAFQTGLTCLLRVSLIDYHERFVNEGSIPNYAYDNWDKMYSAYRELGGNGMMEGMNRDIKELPFRPHKNKGGNVNEYQG